MFGPSTASLSREAVNQDLDVVRQQIDDQEICPTTGFELIATIRGGMQRGEELISSGARRVADLEGRVMTHDPVAAEDSVLQIDTRRLASLCQQYGHLKNSADLEREYLQEVLDLFQTRVSNELNRASTGSDTGAAANGRSFDHRRRAKQTRR